MTEQGNVFAPGFRQAAHRISEMRPDDKPTLSVMTENTCFQANTLDEAMQLWRASDDKSKVLSVGSLG